MRALRCLFTAASLAAAIYALVFHVWPWVGYNVPLRLTEFAAEPEPPGWDKVKPHLAEAERLSAQALEKRLHAVAKFFDDRKDGCRAFAESALSLKGKWKMATSTVLMDDEHAKFLAREFTKHVFDPEELGKVLEAAVEGFRRDIDAIEGRALVAIRADLADDELLCDTLGFDLRSEEAFFEALERVVEDVAPGLGIDLGVSLATVTVTTVGPGAVAVEAVSAAVMQILSAVAAEAGITGSFYGAGLISGGVTLGVGVVVFAIADRIIAQVLTVLGYDAEKRVASDVAEGLARTRDRVVGGIPGAASDYASIRRMAAEERTPFVRSACLNAQERIERGGALGLRWQLGNIKEKRAKLLRATIRAMLTEAAEVTEAEAQ